MKKIICYFSEENSQVLLNDEPGAIGMYLTPEQIAAIKERPDLDEPKEMPGPVEPQPLQGIVSSTIIDELIALKKGGFTSAEIIELKQSQLL
jgi:hypothetical protein